MDRCPNCASLMNCGEGETCPECEHVNDENCECPECAEKRREDDASSENSEE